MRKEMTKEAELAEMEDKQLSMAEKDEQKKWQERHEEQEAWQKRNPRAQWLGPFSDRLGCHGCSFCFMVFHHETNAFYYVKMGVS